MNECLDGCLDGCIDGCLNARQVLVPPLSGWSSVGARVPERPTVAPVGLPASGREQEPLERLLRCLDRMDALVTLLEADLRRQQDLLASLTTPERVSGPLGGGGWAGPPGGHGGSR
ncbi:hypothetical protein [Frankia sp. R82]|uniref:hypothetical protein n=1 Tax=Frankia sp. R82 TaxID=2950553 RepID=UPI002043D931|nr:hypothetical protein [Frankia sp. R82]MCM3886178.1 hypothetical protein [Frankia sp. R82]